MKKYQYFLFDWDGTLAQTLEVWLSCLKIALEKRGRHLSDKEIGADFVVFKKRVSQMNIPDVAAIVDEADMLSRAELRHAELYPNALFVLETLHAKNKRLALVTTSHHKSIELSLDKHGLNHLFDAVVCGDDVENLKPHAEPIEKALALLGGSRDLAVMIGDSEKDIDAAHNAGVDVVLFHPERHKVFYDLEKLASLYPTYIFENFREIIDLA